MQNPSEFTALLGANCKFFFLSQAEGDVHIPWNFFKTVKNKQVTEVSVYLDNLYKKMLISHKCS